MQSPQLHNITGQMLMSIDLLAGVGYGFAPTELVIPREAYSEGGWNGLVSHSKFAVSGHVSSYHSP